MKALIVSIFGIDSRPPRWFLVLVLLAVTGLGWRFVTAAVEHGIQKNTVSEYNDQRFYMNAARVMRETNYECFVSRMRMPLYMWVLSVAAEKWQDVEAFFPRARVFNVCWSLGLLVVMFAAVRKWMGSWLALAFCFMAAGQFFVLKAAYVQPELTLATIVVITSLWLVNTLQRPTWKNALISGLLLCLWFLTKASAQIVLGMFGAMLGVKWLFAGKGNRKPYIIAGLVTLAAYLLPMSPYLWTSYKVFGDPFYNVQGKYYMWANLSDNETVNRKEDEKHWLQGLGLEQSLDKILPSDKERLPSAGKYWREHPWRTAPGDKNTKDANKVGIVDRLMKGLDIMFKLALNEYTALFYFIALWAGITMIAVATHWNAVVRGFFAYGWEMLYITMLLTLFVLLFGWFAPMQVGPRLILSVALVAPAFFFAITHHLLKNDAVMCFGVALSVEKLLAVAFIATWAAVTSVQATSDLAMSFFGG